MKQEQNHQGGGDNVGGNKIVQNHVAGDKNITINLPKALTITAIILMLVFAGTLVVPLLNAKESETTNNTAEKNELQASPQQGDDAPIQKAFIEKDDPVETKEPISKKEKPETTLEEKTEEKTAVIQVKKDTIPTSKVVKELPAPPKPEEKDYYQASGTCILNYEKYKNKTQAKLVAKKCAQLIAKSGLAENLLGLDIGSELKVKSNDLAENEIKTKLASKIPRIYEAGELVVSDESVTITVRIKKKDLINSRTA